MTTPSESPVLWPARNVGEHAYCPRLFYYMQVEGVFLPSADTEMGRFAHRRVDRPSSTVAEPDDPDRPVSVRSLVLTSQRLRLTATLDLAEISKSQEGGLTAIPVEYRKGRPRRLELIAADNEEEPDEAGLARCEPWPTDRVQVGLQVLLLEEHGYRVPQAVLYYAAERQRLVVQVDDKLRQEALQELEAAERTARGSRPLPLVNDPKCPRCSLQPICLPDEINHERIAAQIGADAVAAPRRIWLPRDDALQVVAQTDGLRIGVRGESIRFVGRDGKVARELPLAGIESLLVVGHAQVSTQAIHALADRGVCIVFASSAGRTVAVLEPPGPTPAAVRTAQVLRLRIDVDKLELARALITAKIANQRVLILRNAVEPPAQILADLNEQARRAATAPSMAALLGHEGQAASLYFAALPTLIRDDAMRSRFSKSGRQRRPPPDPFNALLSFGYSMLTNECVSALRTAMLDPTLGAMHTPRPGRPAMALDLMEPFRPLIADSVALSLVNRGEVRKGHFLDTAAGVALTEYGRRAFFSAWGRRMATVVSHPTFDYRLSYRRMLMLHARLISAWLQGEAPTLSFLTTR